MRVVMLRVSLVAALALASCKPQSTAAPEQRRKGTLDKDVIRQGVRAHFDLVNACYAAALARYPDARGRVTLRFTIGATGAVTAVDILSNEVGDDEIGDCMAYSATRWTFPPPKGGGDVVVTYPFQFETESP